MLMRLALSLDPEVRHIHSYSACHLGTNLKFRLEFQRDQGTAMSVLIPTICTPCRSSTGNCSARTS